jgi:D-threo-aldose 1-dehydrogenase
VTRATALTDPGERVLLGRTRVGVTRIGLGGAPIGGLFSAVDEDAALATIDTAYARGLRLFDTAPLYGHGLSEQRLGRVLASRPRDDFVLATKVGRLLRPDVTPDHDTLFRGTPPVGPVFDFSYDGALRSIDESLERLGLDRVDIVHVHDPDDHYDEALRGAFPALARLRDEGAISAVGAGMNQVEMLERFAREADFDCFLVAGRYTLLDQSALTTLLPLCVERGIGVIIGGVYNSGILAGPSAGSTFDYHPAPPNWLERALALEAACNGHDVPLKAAALQFPLAHPAVSSMLLGARSSEELDESVELLSVEIPGDLWADLRRAGLLPEDAPVP